MKSYQKAPRFLILYLGGLLLTIGLLVTWIVILNTTSGTAAEDKWLLGAMFAILFLGELSFILLYVLTPKVTLMIDDQEVTIFRPFNKERVFSLREISSFASTKRTIFVMTKDNHMYSVRFMTNVKVVENELRTILNEFITTKTDVYFADNK